MATTNYGSGLLGDFWSGYRQKRAASGRPLSSGEMRGLIGPMMAAERKIAMDAESAARAKEAQDAQIKQMERQDRAATVSGAAGLLGTGASVWNAYKGNEVVDKLANAKLAEVDAINRGTDLYRAQLYRSGALPTGAPGIGLAPSAPYTPAAVPNALGSMAPSAATSAAPAAAGLPGIASPLAGGGAAAAPATAAAPAAIMGGQGGLAVQGASGMTFGSGGTAASTAAANAAAPSTLGAVAGPAALGGGIGSYLGGRFHEKIGVNEDIGQGLGGVAGGALAGAMVGGPVGALVGAGLGLATSFIDDLF